jgi:tRNA threonylcarbamoyl adenosine modification protein YeaZ
LCLLEDGAVVVDRVIEPSGTHRQETAAALLPSIKQVLQDASWDKSSLSALVVGQGPGSFTGVRTSVVTARTLAQALNLPLLGVCRLECVAQEMNGPAAVVLSGAPNHYFVAGYDAGESKVLKVTLEPCYLNLSDVVLKLKPFKRWAADHAALETLGDNLTSGEPLPAIKNLALVQAQIAWARLSQKADNSDCQVENYPWYQVEPLYLRGASVTLKKTHGDSSKSHDPS